MSAADRPVTEKGRAVTPQHPSTRSPRHRPAPNGLARPIRLRSLAHLLVVGSLLAACASSKQNAAQNGAAADSTSTTVAPTTATTAASAVVSSTSTTAAATTAAPTATIGPTVLGPAGDAFYTPPSPLPPGKPGDIIWTRPFTRPGGSLAWSILYRSTAIDGGEVVVSGTVFAPSSPAPAGGRPVLSWAHGTTGLGDQCAPSRAYQTNTAADGFLVDLVLKQDTVFVATDYQGLGTPGEHPYLMNRSAGTNVLDAARAAEQLTATGATSASKVVLFGHSQGGSAVVLADELAGTYAPELHVVGAVAGAPPADLTAFGTALSGSSNFGYEVMVLDGLRAAYPSLPLAAALTSAGAAALDLAATQCLDQTLSTFAGKASSAYVDAAFLAEPGVTAALKDNSGGFIHSSVPLFVFHGETDTTVPPANSKSFTDRACALGNPVARKTYPGVDHVGVLLPAAGDILAFIAAREAGTPFVSTCPG
jgi:pimeloyl-ACP methyl ester carboxylesterase